MIHDTSTSYHFSSLVALYFLINILCPNYYLHNFLVQGQQQEQEPPVYDNFHDISASLRSLLDLTSVTFTGNWANDVNEQNDASGTAVVNGYLRPWVWSSSLNSALFLPIPENRSYGGQGSMISDRFEGTNEALVLGNLQIDVFDEPGRAFLWHVNMDTLDIVDSFELPVWNGKDRTLAIAVNNRGLVLARSTKYWSLPDVLFLYDFFQDSYREIEFPVVPVDMNNNGDLIGGTYIGINRIPGDFSTMEITDVGLPPVETFQVTAASLTAINDYGMAAATLRKTYSDGAGRRTSAMSRYNGTAYDLNHDGGAFAGSIDISNNGNVLGVIGVGGSIVPAMYIQKTNKTYSVNSLLDPQLTAQESSFFFYEAYAMNNAGVIAGSITDRGAVLLIPRTTVVENGYCVDSTLMMFMGLRMRSCQWVAMNAQNRCLKLKVDSHCPVTCGACPNNQCTDSQKPFQLEDDSGKKSSCKWVKRKDTLARCHLPGVATTCRQTCNECEV